MDVNSCMGDFVSNLSNLYNLLLLNKSKMIPKVPTISENFKKDHTRHCCFKERKRNQRHRIYGLSNIKTYIISWNTTSKEKVQYQYYH